MNRLASIVLIPAVAALMLGCSKTPPSDAAKADGAPASWLLTSAPADPATLSEAKATAVEGDMITIRGRIGGRNTPIAPDSAVFTIVDLSLPFCGQMDAEDGCKTPWDYCCETKDTITAHSATIQLVDAKGNPIETNPIDAGLHALDEVIVVGTVGPRPNADVFTVRATGIYRNPG